MPCRRKHIHQFSLETEEFILRSVAPTMNGRFYGGGMMPTPNQNRLNEDGLVSAMVMFGSGKLKTLMVFPSIFRGKHIKHSEFVNVHSGQEIEVEFDRPAALQIDGETILNVSKYTVCLKSMPAGTVYPVFHRGIHDKEPQNKGQQCQQDGRRNYAEDPTVIPFAEHFCHCAGRRR